VPFLDVPLTADEGGYGEVARLWAGGHALYTQTWIDRPQGLILLFRGALRLGLTSTVELRLVAAGVGAALVLATMAVAGRGRQNLPALAAGALAATAAASPFIEGFTLAGEAVAAVLAALSVRFLLDWEERDEVRALVAAGVLAGAAMLVKQTAFDAGLVAATVVLVRRRRDALRPLAVLAASAMAAVAAAALASGDPGAWWEAVVGYGAHASGAAEPLGHRLGLLASSLRPAALALAPAAVLAASGYRRAPLALRVWPAAAAAGVLAGGNSHPHYYLQLVAPLACLGGLAVTRLPSRRTSLAAVAGASAACVAAAVPLWPMDDAAQTRAIWPQDPHLASDAAVAAYVAHHSSPGRPVYVLWAAANVYFLADRPPAYRYLWLRNLQTIRGAVGSVRHMLVTRPPAYVVAVQPPAIADVTGATRTILRRDYRAVARFGATTVYRPRSSPRGRSSSTVETTERRGRIRACPSATTPRPQSSGPSFAGSCGAARSAPAPPASRRGSTSCC
jgi:hypothetical protein